jgi:thiol-disulfide isomerase/thioredoxin
MQPSLIGARELPPRGDGALKVRVTDPQEKHMLNRWTMVTAAALVAASGAMAQESAGTLKVGDKAPKLSIETWVKGKKIDKFESGKVYVVEFWATWCGPCIKGIPHLTELQKEYKDKNVTVIGVASSERGEAKAKLAGVENFVKKQGNEMNYTVAYDEDRSMSNDWMKPADQKGIPCAFLVNADGKIAWIGHPMNGLDQELKKAVQANKRTGMKDSDSPRQIASTSESSSSTGSSSGASSETKSTTEGK